MRILRWISGRSTYRRLNDTRERRVHRPAACCAVLPVWWRIAERTRSGVCVLRAISRWPKLDGPRRLLRLILRVRQSLRLMLRNAERES